MPPDQHRSTLCDDVACRGGEWSDVQWSPDGSSLGFVSMSSDHKLETLRDANPLTGAIREVLEDPHNSLLVVPWRVSGTCPRRGTCSI
jgi:hypothetical protein